MGNSASNYRAEPKDKKGISMQTSPKDTSEMFDPQKMLSIVERLKADGRMPTLEKLDEVLRKYRKEYLAQVHVTRKPRSLRKAVK
jgi:collagenase-like PrtC family protease